MTHKETIRFAHELANAILAGRRQYPQQSFGKGTDPSRNAACTQTTAVSGGGFDWRKLLVPIPAPRCKCSCGAPIGDVGYLLIHLNDSHRCTREEIADAFRRAASQMQAEV